MGPIARPMKRTVVRGPVTGFGRRRRSRLWKTTAIFHVLFLWMIGSVPVGAQGLLDIAQESVAAPTPVADPTSEKAIAARRTAVAEELREIERELGGADPTSLRHLESVRTRLRNLDQLLSEEADLVATKPAGSPKEPTAGFEGGPDVTTTPSVFVLNALYEQRRASEELLHRRDQLLASSRQALDAAKEKFELAERERRKARSALESADADTKRRAERTLRLRRLDSRIAQEEIYALSLRDRAAKNLGAFETTIQDLDEKIRVMRARLAEGAGDSSAGLTALVARGGELQRSREATQRKLETVEIQLSAAENRYAKRVDPSAELLEEIESLTSRRDAIRQEISLFDEQLVGLAEQRKVWQRWDGLLRGSIPRSETVGWEADALERIAKLGQQELERQGRISDLQVRISAIDGRLAKQPADSRLRPALEEQRQTLARLQAAQRLEVSSLVSDRLLSERFLAELRHGAGELDFVELASRTARTIAGIWNYEITTVDDAPITVGSLFLALLFFGVGLWAAQRGSAFVGRTASDRFHLDVGGANALQTLSFYALLVAFMLMALRAVHFPLTAFTVLGGALAIGIGFGSQNVMNNFISGLILMLERPVRASDVVEIDGSHGTVERIGARSTQIRSTDGRHIVVPNSFFLESNVVNWTLSDDLIRARVSVGVIYGSPTRLVEDLIRRVVTEDDHVLRNPAPIIIFQEFGDNSLNFDVYFWVQARSPMEVQKVQSRIRFGIDDVFRANDLVIAFPQRDVHLDSVSPIEIRVLER